MTILEQDKDLFDESHYDSHYFEGHLARYNSPVYSQRVANVQRFMGEVDGLDVLDLGCGVGFFGGLARSRGGKVVGLDFSEAALKIAQQQQQGIPFLRGDATCVPFPDASFDVVLLNDIIEHLAEAPGRTMIQEVFRILRPGGRLIVDTDNDAFLMQRKGLKRLNEWLEAGSVQRKALAEIKKTYSAPTLHIKIYTVHELRALLSGVGFRIDAFDTYPYIAVPSRDTVLNLPGLRSLFRNVKGDVQIFKAVKPG